MMKSKARINGRDVLFIGLEAVNIQRLQQGQPIFFHGEVMEIPGLDICLHYGETKEAMMAEMRKHGLTFPPGADEAVAAQGREPRDN